MLEFSFRSSLNKTIKKNSQMFQITKTGVKRFSRDNCDMASVVHSGNNALWENFLIRACGRVLPVFGLLSLPALSLPHSPSPLLLCSLAAAVSPISPPSLPHPAHSLICPGLQSSLTVSQHLSSPLLPTSPCLESSHLFSSCLPSSFAH